ncbi:MAG: choice-of-anchor tandem repeat GloVer-containing protein [Candidatus Korobacteraceae bacterium]
MSPLYDFAGGGDGANPFGGVIRDSTGVVYGTTVNGGADDGGTVFQLRPSATRQVSAITPWTETILYSFHHGGSDGINPFGNPVFDNAGNLYGTTYAGGTTGNGMVYELTPSSGGEWTEAILHNFRGPDGAGPRGTMIFDSAGNLYGTTESGGTYGCGTVFEITPSGSGWNESVLYNFTGNGDGCRVWGGVILDQAGNLYGASPMTTIDPSSHGVVFELSPSAGGWGYTLLYTFTSGYIDVCSFGNGTGPVSSLTMDSSGALYGTTGGDGFYEAGNVFKLAPSNGSWVYTSMHDFDPYTDNSTAPCGGPVLDAAGNIYGTAAGQDLNTGTVWEVTP